MPKFDKLKIGKVFQYMCKDLAIRGDMMSLIKRLEEINVDKKTHKSHEKEVDPYSELKIKIQNRVIEELEIDFNEISDQNEELKQRNKFYYYKAY